MPMSVPRLDFKNIRYTAMNFLFKGQRAVHFAQHRGGDDALRPEAGEGGGAVPIEGQGDHESVPNFSVRKRDFGHLKLQLGRRIKKKTGFKKKLKKIF